MAKYVYGSKNSLFLFSFPLLMGKRKISLIATLFSPPPPPPPPSSLPTTQVETDPLYLGHVGGFSFLFFWAGWEGGRTTLRETSKPLGQRREEMERYLILEKWERERVRGKDLARSKSSLLAWRNLLGRLENVGKQDISSFLKGIINGV